MDTRRRRRDWVHRVVLEFGAHTAEPFEEPLTGSWSSGEAGKTKAVGMVNTLVGRPPP